MSSASFTFELADSVVRGAAGSELIIRGKLTNISTSKLKLEIVRTRNQMPEGWGTSLCLDLCLPRESSTTSVTMGAGISQPFSLYFYTGSVPDSGLAEVSFTNAANPNDLIVQNFHGVTWGGLSGAEIEVIRSMPVVELISDRSGGLRLSIADAESQSHTCYALSLYNVLGDECLRADGLVSGSHQLSPGSLPAGLYLYRLTTNEGRVVTGRTLLR